MLFKYHTFLSTLLDTTPNSNKYHLFQRLKSKLLNPIQNLMIQKSTLELGLSRKVLIRLIILYVSLIEKIMQFKLKIQELYFKMTMD
jgi:DNA-directed RNA polymerase subunit N (RpoN/RPB10)